MAIKITGFDPDKFEKPDPEPRSGSVRRSTQSSTPAPMPQAREVRKTIDAGTAEHLRIKYGMTNVKFTEVAPKKATAALKSYKSGSSAKGAGPRLKAGPPDEPRLEGSGAPPQEKAAAADHDSPVQEPPSAGAEAVDPDGQD